MMTDDEFLDTVATFEPTHHGWHPIDKSALDRLLALARKGAAVQWRPIAEADIQTVVLGRNKSGKGFLAHYYPGAKLWMTSAMGNYGDAATHFIPLSALEQTP